MPEKNAQIYDKNMSDDPELDLPIDDDNNRFNEPFN